MLVNPLLSNPVEHLERKKAALIAKANITILDAYIIGGNLYQNFCTSYDPRYRVSSVSEAWKVFQTEIQPHLSKIVFPGNEPSPQDPPFPIPPEDFMWLLKIVPQLDLIQLEINEIEATIRMAGSGIVVPQSQLIKQ